jgi:hypothetical protein
MGLDIDGWMSKKEYHTGYHGIHIVRTLALKALGIDNELTAEVIENKRLAIMQFHSANEPEPDHELIVNLCLKEWLYGDIHHELNSEEGQVGYLDGEDISKIEPYRQLINFSDCEGILVPRGFLEGIEYQDSLHLGCSNDLYEELETLSAWILDNAARVTETELKVFNMLHDLVKDECENGKGILRFH